MFLIQFEFFGQLLECSQKPFWIISKYGTQTERWNNKLNFELEECHIVYVKCTLKKLIGFLLPLLHFARNITQKAPSRHCFGWHFYVNIALVILKAYSTQVIFLFSALVVMQSDTNKHSYFVHINAVHNLLCSKHRC